MNRFSSFPSFQPGGRPVRASPKTAQGVAEFLRNHDKMAVLLPAVMRMTELQKDCSEILPTLFDTCSVLHFEAGQLVLATPNAAIASKLKQQLPKLQDGLIKRGWQVNVTRLKVQVGKIVEKHPPPKQLTLPAQAFSALAILKDTLEESPRNSALKAALETMLKRHSKKN